MDLARHSRAVEAAAHAQARWWARLVAGDEAARAEAPLDHRRDATGKTLRDALRDWVPSLAEKDLHAALVPWVEALTVQRVTRDLAVELVAAMRAPKAVLHLETVREVALVDVVRGLVAARVPELARRHLDAVAERAPDVLPLRRRHAELAREVLVRFGVAAPEVHGIGDAAALTALRTAAQGFLRRTDDLARDERRRATRLAGERWPLALDLASARAATEGWPTKLAPRFVLEALPRWTEGLRLPAFRVPEAHGGASFARAFFAFGHALRHASAPRALPFVLRVPVVFVDAERWGFAFASLLGTSAFSIRRLGLAQRPAAAQARAFASAFLIEARRVAARLLVGDGVAADEMADAVWGEPHRASAWFLEPAPGDAARAVALFGVAPLLDELRQRHDEDWFDNPRAVTDLRGRAAAPDPERNVVGEGADLLLARALEGALR